MRIITGHLFKEGVVIFTLEEYEKLLIMSDTYTNNFVHFGEQEELQFKELKEG